MGAFPERLLVANRGEIARRVIATARRLGIESVAVHHQIDAGLPFVAEADLAVPLEGDVPVQAYLDGAQIIRIAREVGATAIHPGYGFLAENAQFARDVVAAGLTWVGPSPETIAVMGDKVEARRVVAEAGVPISGGADDALASVEEALLEASRIGYPVMVKAAGGGGGIGMAVAHDADALRTAFDGTRSMAERSFGSGRVFVEKFVSTARHVEVQVLGLDERHRHRAGGARLLGATPPPEADRGEPGPGARPEGPRTDAPRVPCRRPRSSATVNAGTVEFLLDTISGEFVFLEMNTRIQVEHPVTELTYGVDLVEQQLSIAHTGTTTADFAPSPRGHADRGARLRGGPEAVLPPPGPDRRVGGTLRAGHPRRLGVCRGARGHPPLRLAPGEGLRVR